MRFSFITVILATLTLGFASCNEGGNTAVESKPMTGSDKAAPSEPAVNAKPQAFDPAKDGPKRLLARPHPWYSTPTNMTSVPWTKVTP